MLTLLQLFQSLQSYLHPSRCSQTLFTFPALIACETFLSFRGASHCFSLCLFLPTDVLSISMDIYLICNFSPQTPEEWIQQFVSFSEFPSGIPSDLAQIIMSPFTDMSTFRFTSIGSTLAILIAFSREPSRLSQVMTAAPGLQLVVVLALLLPVLLSSVFNRASSVTSMPLPAPVFSVQVWNGDVIAIRFHVFRSDAAGASEDFFVILLVAS